MEAGKNFNMHRYLPKKRSTKRPLRSTIDFSEPQQDPSLGTLEVFKVYDKYHIDGQLV